MKPSRMIEGLIVDNFAGGGGASSGIEEAFGRPVDIAINHDNEAVAMHKANHPDTVHICQSVWKADPVEVVAGRPVALAWFSPDCKHFSKAKGGKPVEKNIRDLAWVVVHWARRVRPRVIMLENVEEFRTWCPVDPVTGLPMKRRTCDGQMTMLSDVELPRKGKRKVLKPEGETFLLWKAALKKEGYTLEHREIRGCDHGEPTIRKRLFVIARCDREPIVWPEATHGPGLKPYRTAANDVIDWSIPCPSIFDRKKPLAENTLRRIAHGIMKFVVNAAEPFIVPVCNSTWHRTTAHSIDRGLPTVTTAKGGEFALVSPYVVPLTHQGEPQRVYDSQRPLPTVTSAHRGEMALVAPVIERQFGNSRGADAAKPLPTVTADGGGKSALVAAFIAKHTTGGIGRDARQPINSVTANSFVKRPGGAAPIGVVAAHLAQFNTNPNGTVNPGHHAREPVSTIATVGPHQGVVASHLVKLRGTTDAHIAASATPANEPVGTVSAGGGRGGTHVGQVCAFLTKYFGSAEHGQECAESLHTVTALPRFGLVTVTIAGEEWIIVDIGMRMLTPRELARAQGMRDSYILDPVCDRRTKSGKLKRGPLPISSQIRMIGNSVNRRVARALVAANCNERMPLEQQAQAA